MSCPDTTALLAELFPLGYGEGIRFNKKGVRYGLP